MSCYFFRQHACEVISFPNGENNSCTSDLTAHAKHETKRPLRSFCFTRKRQARIPYDNRPYLIPRGRSNSIPWYTSFYVILSLRTWHIMISILHHARNEHRSGRYVRFPSVFRFSSFCFWEYRVSLYSLCFKGEFQSYFEGFYMCLRTTCALGRNYTETQSMRLGN